MSEIDVIINTPVNYEKGMKNVNYIPLGNLLRKQYPEEIIKLQDKFRLPDNF
ncbi:MAG: hypothetical protein ABIF11_07150 [Nitrospirota bacterium]